MFFIQLGIDDSALPETAVAGTWIISFETSHASYLMGVGTPSDILGAVQNGVDMFDCVLPTRSGRTGLAFTWNGKINLRNSKYQRDDTPINKDLKIRNLNMYSKSYINHLFNSNEILASMILTLNNIIFYQQLMSKIRETIKNNTFNDFYNKYHNII